MHISTPPLFGGTPLLASLLIPLAGFAGTISFDGPEYAAGQTVIGVNDSAIANSAVWQLYQGASSAVTASSSNPAAGAKALRIVDDSATTACITYLDTAGEIVVNEASRTFSISFDIRLSGTHASTGTLQAQIQFGRAAASSWNDFKSWLHLDLNGNDIRFFVYDQAAPDRKKPVVVAQNTANQYTRVSVVFDAIEKTYASVVINGVDVTHRVRAVNGGALPWRGLADLPGNPDFNFWVTTGTDDRLILDLDNVRIAQTAEPWISAESEEWLPYLFSNTALQVEANSALDFSGLNPSTSSTIAARGFAEVDRDGDLAFSDGTKARLLCAAESIEWLLSNVPVNQLDNYVLQLKRAGYNAYRPHFLDHFLMAGSTNDRELNSSRFIAWQSFVKKLKDAGIYLLMDATTSWTSYYASSAPWENPARLKRLKTRLYWDQAARNHWLAAVSQIYTTVNPDTGTALKDDPQVIASSLRNEPGLFFQLKSDTVSPPLKDEPGLVDAWHHWLKYVQPHYANVAQLNTAWQLSANNDYDSFDDVPLPAADTGIFVALRDLQKFAVHLEQETFQWLQQSFHALGVRSLSLDYNCEPGLPASMSRDASALSDYHAYHDHGGPATGYYWTHDNTSSAQDTLGYLRLAAQTRQWGRPFTVSEWSHVYWNPWRHEAGLVFPGYASLQGWSLIAQHGHPVILAPKALDHFNIHEDPPRKATERMAALLYRRGDVATSPHRLEVVVKPTNGDPGQTHYANTIGIGWPLANAALLTRVGLRFEWPRILRDDFEDGWLPGIVENNAGLPSYFWNATVQGSGSATTTGGSLRLRATGQPNASTVVLGGSSTNDAFNFFENSVTFSASGIEFDPDGDVPADKQVLRFALTSNYSQTYGANDCVTLEIRPDNAVTLGYKVDNTSPPGAFHVVTSFTDSGSSPRAIEGFSFNPNSTYLDAFSSPASDPTYELVIYYRAGTGQPAFRRFSGRWKKESAHPALTKSAWGSGGTGNSYVQFDAQKLDGVSAKWMRVSVADFRVGTFPSAPTGTQAPLPADLSLPLPQPEDFSATVAALRTANILASHPQNETVAAASKSSHDGIYHSDTGELRFEPLLKSMRVSTPRSEGGTLPVLNPAVQPVLDLPHLNVKSLPAPSLPNSVSVLISSLQENATVRTSSKLLLILSADALNSGQKFEDYRRLKQLGGTPERGTLPILLRRSKVEVSLDNDYRSTLKVYPLKPDGSRHALPLPTSIVNNRLRFTIDTGDLPGGPAVYFELAP